MTDLLPSDSHPIISPKPDCLVSSRKGAVQAIVATLPNRFGDVRIGAVYFLNRRLNHWTNIGAPPFFTN